MKKRFLSFAAGLLCLCCLTSFMAPEAALKYADTQFTVAQSTVSKPGTVAGLKAAPAGKNRVKLTWSAVSGAEGYLVYAQKSGTYGYVGMTTKGTTYTDTKALDSDYNYYFVFAYVKDSNGKMIAGACDKYVYAKGICPAVTGLKAASTTSGVKLTWSEVNTADGYLIYGKTRYDTYGYKGMTTDTAWIDSEASSREYSFYWVFAYHENPSGKKVVGGTCTYVCGKKVVPEYMTAKLGDLTYSYATAWDLNENPTDGADEYSRTMGTEYYSNMWRGEGGNITFGYDRGAPPANAADYDFDFLVSIFSGYYTYEYEDGEVLSIEKGTSGDLKYANIVARTGYNGGKTFRSKILYDTKTGMRYFFEAAIYDMDGEESIAAFNKRIDVCFASIKKV